MTGLPSLVIGIASSSAERRQLAQLLGGTESFLIVSSAHQARRFLDLVRRPALAPAPPPPSADETPAEPSGRELAVDSDRRVLRWREREIGLTPLEHDLLVCLTGTPGQVWPYARLHRAVWGNDHLGRGSDMHSVVRRIRHKLGRLDAPATIHAVRGVGFRLTP
ncbi:MULTISPECIES: winged helix-turn-helix domain-containing protein [unclassified Micromonospora]|uniref:winged helix-turn-helix domain-containing protein n=1 Tax=unclassified Micromonospora TaxID=2617518 RepID=UPI001C21781F|nr:MULTISPECIES: winged helix-turn-helix domain-containing protein [unclassified Micromonospora]MBU8859836.1 winged helix-turn-helix domain-containing protein [Micromonospora sp. WMMB482]MDM4779357.1 winged helix-turn-helix domain-containing protein [Micromonospora sp. b486]